MAERGGVSEGVSSLLVNYSSSSDSNDEEASPVVKKYKESATTPLQLPEAIVEMFKEADHVDVSELHDGRKRSFAHIRGNWPTYVFISVIFPDGFHKAIESFMERCPQFLRDLSMIRFNDHHISLSRTVPIQYHWIQPLTTSLMESINNHKRFTITFDEIMLYVNDDKTRSFIGLHVQEGQEELCSIVDDVDVIFEKFKLPKFYQERSFHVSLCWTLGDILPKISQELDISLKSLWTECLTEQDFGEELTVNVSEIHCKTGNKNFTFKLTTLQP